MAICVIVMLAAAWLLAACGGGGSGRAPTPPVSVLVSQASASVPARSTEQFTASVQNDPASMGVVWSVHGTACNGGPCGTIDNPNANPVTYSAPAQVPSPATETLVATAVANGNASASVAITVTAEIKVSVPAASAEVPANTSQQFAASIQNDLNNQGIVWSLRGAACNGGPCGSLGGTSANPVTYYAPDHVPSPAVETLVATSLADGNASASIALTITNTIVISVSPGSMTIALGDTRQFSAGVVNDSGNLGVTWTVMGCPAGAPCGSFSPANTLAGAITHYTAPASVPQGLQVTVVATSVADPTKFATAQLTISKTAKAIAVAVAPATASIAIGSVVPLTAIVSNDSTNAGVQWALSGCTNGPCGDLSSVTPAAANYLAPRTPQTAQPGTQVTIVATSVADADKSATVTVTLDPSPINFKTQSQPVGHFPIAVITGDFNSDGIVDVAVADAGDPASGDPGDVAILLGTGDGTFRPATHFPAGMNPFAIVVGDFNGDGKADLAVTDLGDRRTGGKGTVAISLGNGDGSFQTPVSYPAGTLPGALAVADFNGDGKLDLAAAEYGDSARNFNGGVNLLLGNGDERCRRRF
jgi:FG-GAP-like repeat